MKISVEKFCSMIFTKNNKESSVFNLRIYGNRIESLKEIKFLVSNRLFELSERYVRAGLIHSVPLTVRLVEEYNKGFQSRYIESFSLSLPFLNFRFLEKDLILKSTSRELAINEKNNVMTEVALDVYKIVNNVAIKEKYSIRVQLPKHWFKEKLKLMFPNLFSEKMGCIKDVEVKLDIDPNVKPVKQKLRPVALHLQDAVKNELDKQVEEGIFEKVDFSMGPKP
ncbi:hypothetical protein BpHYR1_004156 [Brachionus plicatilis]|uniref:Uncharacterized protein n=1 Tax=Brachionus plicatilis TaxID=10195 RepID=A0A3M7PGY5_BRAPC|nr:hypothetical protein BpHYR1_004156 [Brachionus plicatilis]